METNYKARKFKIKIRPEYKGRKPRRDYSAIQGKEVMLQWCGRQDEDETYPGEEMLTPAFHSKETKLLFEDNDLVWLASGDVVEI